MPVCRPTVAFMPGVIGLNPVAWVCAKGLGEGSFEFFEGFCLVLVVWVWVGGFWDALGVWQLGQFRLIRKRLVNFRARLLGVASPEDERIREAVPFGFFIGESFVPGNV